MSGDCLPNLDIWVQTPVRSLLNIFKEVRKKGSLCVDIRNGKTYEKVYTVHTIKLMYYYKVYVLNFMITDDAYAA